MQDWISIFSSPDTYQVELIKQLLLHQDIPAVILNKKDSAYQVFGEASLYVPKSRQREAQELIDQNSDFSDFSFSPN